ncbi:Replication factor C, subunit RFC4 [Collariella sp. IMI 366227]|nr:Replication factor C, subunit RFC4 [Collariella sp. IMI 366227]
MNNYLEASNRALEHARTANKTEKQRLMDWGRENRYTIVFASWVAAMGIAMAIVNRNKFISTSQKLVQARVYAQGLTLAVLIATAALETADAKAGKGRWETVMVVDPDDPTHQHMIEKRIHKEDYEGQDLWKRMLLPAFHVFLKQSTNLHLEMVAAEERRLEDQKKQRAEAAKSEKVATH